MKDYLAHIPEIGFVISLLIFLVVIGAIYATKLRASEQLWKFALEGAGDGVWDWDISNDTTHLSDRYKEMFGFSDDDIKTNRREWNNRIHPDDTDSMNTAVKNYLTGKTDKYIHEHRVICKDKSIKWVLSRGMIIKRDSKGKPLRMVGTHTDITARKMLEHKLENLAHFDTLSNLPNRTLLGDRLKLALAYAKRERKKLAVMFIDLDEFKDINDLYGHEAGDKVLQEVSQRLVACVRESDTVARIGGDEFVILLPIIDNADDAFLVANKIVETVIKPIQISQTTKDTRNKDTSAKDTAVNVQVSSSIGIAIYPQHGKDEKLLIINADMAMYQAKSHGRNQAKMFETAMLQ